MKGYPKAISKGLAWSLDPENREAGQSLLLAKMPAIKPGVVGAVMNSLLFAAIRPDADAASCPTA